MGEHAMPIGTFATHARRIFRLSVTVDEAAPWEKTVRETGPEASPGMDPAHHPLSGCQFMFPPQEGVLPQEAKVLLIQFRDKKQKGPYTRNRNRFMEKAMKIWAERQGLVSATPRTILSIGVQHPELPKFLGVEDGAFLCVTTLDSGKLYSSRFGGGLIAEKHPSVCWEKGRLEVSAGIAPCRTSWCWIAFAEK